MDGARVLAIAVASGRVAYVFVVRGELYEWHLSRAAARSPAEAARFAKQWIDRMRPTVVVTQSLTHRCRKGTTARAAIELIAKVAANEEVYDIAVTRPKNYANKFDEANALAERFPELRPRVPKPRRLWDSEPRSTTIFEALALALVVIDRKPEAA